MSLILPALLLVLGTLLKSVDPLIFSFLMFFSIFSQYLLDVDVSQIIFYLWWISKHKFSVIEGKKFQYPCEYISGLFFSMTRKFVLAVVSCNKPNIINKIKTCTRISETSKWSKNCEKLRKNNQNRTTLGKTLKRIHLKIKLYLNQDWKNSALDCASVTSANSRTLQKE